MIRPNGAVIPLFAAGAIAASAFGGGEVLGSPEHGQERIEAVAQQPESAAAAGAVVVAEVVMPPVQLTAAEKVTASCHSCRGAWG